VPEVTEAALTGMSTQPASGSPSRWSATS
jgi:hypothetical protein